jgi:hypothetical protein
LQVFDESISGPNAADLKEGHLYHKRETQKFRFVKLWKWDYELLLVKESRREPKIQKKHASLENRATKVTERCKLVFQPHQI